MHRYLYDSYYHTYILVHIYDEHNVHKYHIPIFVAGLLLQDDTCCIKGPGHPLLKYAEVCDMRN